MSFYLIYKQKEIMNNLMASTSSSKPGENFLSKNEERKIPKKRIRRKPRTAKNKKKNEDLNETDCISEDNISIEYNCHELSSKLRIEPVACNNAIGIFIRKRSTRFKYIKLNKFVKGSNIPVIFKTKLKTQIISTETSLTESFNEISINKSVLPKAKKSRLRFKKSESRKRSKKKSSIVEKKAQPMKGYITENEVEEGLKNSKLVKGIIRINAKNSREAYVSNVNKTVQDYIITSMFDRNGAMEGDEVVLEVKPQSEWKDGKATASVVYILKKVC